MRESHGFTLLEMLVALAVFSLAALALLRLEGATLRQTGDLDDKALAQLVARNLAVDILTDPSPPAIGRTTGEIANGGRRWRYTRQTERTPDQRLVRVDIAVLGRAPTTLTIVQARDLSQRGFTLIELLVALLIFGMLAGAGVALLRFGVDAQAATKTRLDAIAAARRVDSLITGDAAQAVPRPTRNEGGDRLPAFEGEPGRFALVRAGWDNFDDAPRPSLQRVEYRLNGARLERRSWPMLDGAASDPPATIIDQVATLRLRYKSRDGWRDRWDAVRVDLLPRAVELIVRQTGGAEYRYVFLVGAGT